MKVKLTKEGGKNGQRVDSGTDIMNEIGKRDLRRANAAAYGFP